MKKKNVNRRAIPTAVTAYSEGYFEVIESSIKMSDDKKKDVHVNLENDINSNKSEVNLKLEESYRMFRVLMTDVNTSGTHHLFCNGLELYGILYY